MKSLRAVPVQLLLGHTKVEATVRYLGIEVNDALELAEQTDVQSSSIRSRPPEPTVAVRPTAAIQGAGPNVPEAVTHLALRDS